MDCSRARTKDPVEWIETCPEFSWPKANQPATRARRLKEILAALAKGLKWAQRKLGWHWG